jgi:GNAT superfamily N-acetyltransferase
MTAPEFIVASVHTHRDPLIELNVEYMAWVFREIDQLFGGRIEDVIGMPVSDYVPSVIDKTCGKPPPDGVFYLINIDGRLAGMGGLRGLNARQAEVKRIYIRPAFRGMNLGESVLARLLSDARAFGYERVCLDTAPFMKSAHRIYENNGFVDRPAYEGVEVPPEFHARWRFMERELRDGIAGLCPRHAGHGLAGTHD